MISHSRQCIFTHVPKTGGKSIHSLFGLPEFERDYKPQGETVESAFGHRPLSDFAEKEYFFRYYKFAFVRNPFDRLVSAYFYLNQGGCNASDEQFRRDRLARYNGSFDAFVEDLEKFLDADHFRPQAAWLCDAKGALLANFIGRYERLRSDAATICASVGLSFRELPFLNASKHDLYKSYYDDHATRRRVARAYGNDLVLFSYQFDGTV